jgi:tRNA(Ser,Leu) C12 N-acetylase TAN1
MATDITKFNSVKDVDKDEVLTRSKDGKTVVLKDGTKVSDALINEAKTASKARAAAVSAATSAKVDLDDPEFVRKVTAIATEAAQAVINGALPKK